MTESTGKVILVGAGPGDPELITLRGKRAIESADVIVYDHLASRALLDHAPHAEKICVGKRAAQHTMPQDEINRLLAEKAERGLTVVRLKGGDPYVFGRGSEEAEFIAGRRIPLEVVPGIPAAVGAAASAGVPLTDRRYASSVAFVTGHEDPGKAQSSVDWAHLAKGGGTVVIYMGVRNLAEIAARLIEHGRPPDTPVSLIERATTPKQRTLRGTLAGIGELARAENIGPPALAIVGEVNRLGGVLDWFERRPLFGRTVVVTRARAQASELAARLRELGAGVIEMPAISIGPPESWHDLDEAVRSIADYDWLVFTSVNGVDFFMRRLSHAGGDARRFAGLRIAAIGPATADALAAHGLRADVQPSAYVAEALAEAMTAADDLTGKRILLARSDIARDALPTALRAVGAVVDDFAAYRTVPAEFDAGETKALIEGGGGIAVTFTSSSTAEFFAARVGRDFISANAGRIRAVSIGPVTSAALRTQGIEPAAEAAEHTIAGLIAALVELSEPPTR